MAPPGTYPIQQAIRDLQIGGDGPPLPARLPALDEWLRRLGSLPWLAQPGERWMYNTSSDVLGALVARVSGGSLGAFMRERIFDPLGMKDIAFWPSEQQWPRVASVYTRGPNGLQKNQNPNSMSSQVYFMGSGGLISTAEDYIPYGVMLANGGQLNGKRLLSPKTVEMMRSVHVSDALPGRQPGEGYGLSVRVVNDHAKRGTLLSDGSYGWSGAYGTHFFVDPKEQVVAVFMVQTSNQEVNLDFENMVMQSIVE
jgi:CubicO group peptidase (beta-lactamase class C family)